VLENPWQQLGGLATENKVLVEAFVLLNTCTLAASHLRGTLEAAGQTPPVGWRNGTAGASKSDRL